MAVKWGWAEKLDVALTYRPPEQKLVLVEAKDGVSIRLQIEAADALACSFTQLQIEQSGVEDINLRAWAEALENRITYLEEPLKVIEISPECGAILRSYPPYHGTVVIDGQTYEVADYYECWLQARPQRPVSLTFGRHSSSFIVLALCVKTVPCVLTLDILKRLVSDLEAAWPSRPAVAEEFSPLV